MAKKRAKSTARNVTPKPSKTAPARSAARPAPRTASRPAPKKAIPAGAAGRRPVPVPVAARRAATEPTLLARAEQLRDDVLRSKVTHPDPWSYTAKARAFGERAQRLVEDAGEGRDVRRALDALAAEVEADRDYQEARRLF